MRHAIVRIICWYCVVVGLYLLASTADCALGSFLGSTRFNEVAEDRRCPLGVGMS